MHPPRVHLLRAFWPFKLRVDENFVEKKIARCKDLKPRAQTNKTGDMSKYILSNIYIFGFKGNSDNSQNTLLQNIIVYIFRPLAPESRASIYLYVDSTNGISSKLKMHKNIKKHNFIKLCLLLLVTISFHPSFPPITTLFTFFENSLPETRVPDPRR